MNLLGQRMENQIQRILMKEDKELNLFSLSKRNTWGDLVEVLKIFTGFDHINAEDYFTLINQI